jgi:phage baseplate assembly protein gpV
MLRFGTVCDTNHDGGLIRVNLDDDALVSYWLSPVHLTTRNAKPFAPLAIGEHVACLFDEALEDGVVLGAIYSTADKPEGSANRTFLDFLDKVSGEYDSAAGAFIFTNQTVTVTIADDKVTIEKGADSLGAILSDLIDAMTLETHTSAAPGSPTTPPLNAASYTAIKTRLLQFLG